MPIDSGIYNQLDTKGIDLAGIYNDAMDRRSRLSQLAMEQEKFGMEKEKYGQQQEAEKQNKQAAYMQNVSRDIFNNPENKDVILEKYAVDAPKFGVNPEHITWLAQDLSNTKDINELRDRALYHANPKEYEKQMLEQKFKQVKPDSGVHTLEVGVKGKPDYRQKQEKTAQGWSNVGPAYQIPAGTTAAAKAGAPKQISNVDARSIDRSMTTASSANAALQLLDQADALYNKYVSGKDEPITGYLSKWGSLTGDKDAEQHATNFEIGDQIAKDLGVIKLGLIGGSDTERELQVAIDTSPDPDKRPTTNKEIIKNQRKAIEIIQSEPDFKTQWVEKNGSLSRTDIETKEPYGKAWRKYQKDMFNADKKSEQPKDRRATDKSVTKTQSGATASGW